METGVKKQKIWKNVILVGAILVAVLIWFFTQHDFGKIAKAIGTADYRFLLIAVLFIIIYWICNAMSLDLIVRKRENLSRFDSFNIGNLAQFYNGITPFSTGGQPFQVYYYSRLGIKPHKSASYIVMNFIIHQLALNILSVIALITYFSFLTKFNNGVWVAVIVGFVINFTILLLLILVSVLKSFRRFALCVLRLVLKIKPFRKKANIILEKANISIMEFQAGFKELFNNIWLLIITLIVKIIGFMAFFIIPFFIFYALGVKVDESNVPFIIWMSAFAWVVMSFMPTPGAAGGAEWAFTQVFTSLAGVTTVIGLTATLLWRFVTYYLGMLSGLISVLLFERKRKEVIDDEDRDIH